MNQFLIEHHKISSTSLSLLTKENVRGGCADFHGNGFNMLHTSSKRIQRIVVHFFSSKSTVIWRIAVHSKSISIHSCRMACTLCFGWSLLRLMKYIVWVVTMQGWTDQKSSWSILWWAGKVWCAFLLLPPSDIWDLWVLHGKVCLKENPNPFTLIVIIFCCVHETYLMGFKGEE